MARLSAVVLLLAAAALVMPVPARAHAMPSPFGEIMLFSLLMMEFVPMVAVESYIYSRGAGKPYLRTARVALLANAASYVLGIFYNNYLGYAIDYAFVGNLADKSLQWFSFAPLYLEETNFARWFFSIQCMMFLAASLAITCIIEGLVVKWRMRDMPGKAIAALVVKANTLSYALLWAVGLMRVH